MEYRPYGKTGKDISMLSFGGMRFKNIDNRDECVETMLTAARGGVNYFDSAYGYFDGKSEEVFGEAFDEFRRQGLPFYSATKTFAAEEKELRSQLETQLKRMRVEAIDFYHIWCIVTPDAWHERKGKGVIRAFQKLKEEGLINHICISSHLVGEEINELLEEGVFEGVLFGYSAYNFSFRQAVFEAITRQNLGAVVMNPLGGGLIPNNPELFEFLKTNPEQPVVDAALQFLFAHPQITSALVGFEDKTQVQDALRAVETFDSYPAGKLAEIKQHIGSSFEGLCTGCRYCEPCPEDVPISKLMDAYNHKVLYGDDQKVLDRLKWHWSLPPDVAQQCVECGQCEEECTQHLEIISRLKEIASIGKKAAQT